LLLLLLLATLQVLPLHAVHAARLQAPLHTRT
jgi:hypothetical protein